MVIVHCYYGFLEVVFLWFSYGLPWFPFGVPMLGHQTATIVATLQLALPAGFASVNCTWRDLRHWNEHRSWWEGEAI